MAIIKNYKTGELFTPKTAKAFIMKELHLTTYAEYKSTIEKTRNQIRNYETLTGQESTYKSPQELIIAEIKGTKHYGKASREIQTIRATSSASNKNFKAQQERKKKKIEETGKNPPPTAAEQRTADVVFKQWSGLIRLHPTSDPAKAFAEFKTGEITLEQLLKRLRDYGRALNSQRKSAAGAAGGKAREFRAATMYE